MKPSSARVALAIAGAMLELLRVPIPDSVSKFYDANCSLTSVQQYESTGGQPIITPDGSVYVEVYIWEDTNDLGCSGRDQYLKATINLLQVSPEGTPNWSTPFNIGGTEYWDYYMGALIPDGQGGLLASWAGILHNCGVFCHTDFPHVTHITAAGNSEYTLPPNGGYQVSGNGYDPILSSVLGENGTAFAALTGPLGSQFASFNIASGTVNWNWTGSSGFADMIAATSGNGLVVKQYTVNGSGQEVNDQVVRLDPTGAATFDTWTANAIQYAYGDLWPSLGSTRMISALTLLWPNSIWPVLGSAEAGTQSAKAKVKLQVYEVASATATSAFINGRVTSGIGYWLANARILLDWDDTIQVIPDCATTPCSPTDAQDLAQITNAPGLTAMLQRFPNRTSSIIVFFNQSLGFGISGITPLLSPDYANVTALSSTADDVLPHELGHVFDLFHSQNPYNLMCGPVSALDWLPNIYCSTSYSRGITTEQIRTARANASRFKPSGGH